MITLEHLHTIMPSTKSGRGALVFGNLQRAMLFCDIDTPQREAAFLGHVAYESAELIGRPKSSYVRDPYQSRGWIPFAGKDNYQRLKVFTGFDFVRNPDSVNSLEWSPWAAAYLWRRQNGNQMAERWDIENIVREFSYKISKDDGARRLSYLLKAAKTLGAQTGLPQIS